MNSLFKSSIVHHKDQGTEDQNENIELENIIGRPPPSYFLPEYWEERYKKDKEVYEWYQKWDQLKFILIPEFLNRDSALDIGCGNSRIPFELVNEGFQKVVGMDISKTVIDQNKQRHSNIKNLEFVVGDVLSMNELFDDNSFDFIFDKGTMDCLMSSFPTSKKVPAMIAEIFRILKPNGVFIEVSYGTPKTRLPFIKDLQYQWIISEPKKIENLNEEGHYHYVYIAQKNPQKTKS